MKHILTVDIGTTSAKVLLVSQEGEVTFTSQEFYPTQFSSHGRAEQDATVIMQAINTMVGECARSHGDKISAIALSSAMHSVMAVDSEGNPLSPLMIWSDMRSADVARAIRSTPRAAELLEKTGTPVHPMSPLCKLIWLRDSEPQLFSRARKFVSIKEYVVWHWCGQWIVDYSVASSTGLFDIRSLRWSADALGLVGVGEAQLSACVSPYHQIPLALETANQLGLRKDIRVIAGASDGCLAHIGCHAAEPGDVSLTIGTSGAVRKLSKEISSDPMGRLFNYRLDEQAFITGGATNNGTVVIDWFRKNFCKTPGNDLSSFVQEACSVQPAAEGLLFLPFVFGERSPHYNPDMRGVFFGLAQHHRLQHMMRSLLEGICYEMRSLVDAVSETVGPIDQILASGGFIRSSEWVQILANILGREIVVRDVNDASSIGAAMIGFRSLTIPYRQSKAHEESRFLPEPAHKKRYDEMYDLFNRLTAQVPQEFSAIASMQKGVAFPL